MNTWKATKVEDSRDMLEEVRMKVEPVYDKFPVGQSRIKQWEEQYENPAYSVRVESAGGPEKVFTDLRDSTELYINDSLVENLPMKPVDYTLILADCYRLDQEFQSRYDLQLVTFLKQEVEASEFSEAVERLVETGVRVEAEVYGFDGLLSYNSESRIFEVVEEFDQEVETVVDDVLDGFANPVLNP